MSAQIRPKFTGTGGQLFGQLIVGYLLCYVTLGIYVPWFICRLSRYFYNKTTLETGDGRVIRVEFTGTGGELFVTGLVGFLLTVVTLGIYGAWFTTNLLKFFTNNSKAVAEDGSLYQLRYDGTGGELFITFFLGYLLTMVTFGLYLPWFMCRLEKVILSGTSIVKDGKDLGRFDFVGSGAALFGTFVIGYLLTVFTFGIYGAWFNVSMTRFFTRNTQAHIDGQIYAGDFLGTGGELFVIQLVGTILTVLTLGIYMFWYMARLLRFQTDNVLFAPTGEGTMSNLPRAVVR